MLAHASPWAWRVEGHHLSLNFTVVGGRMIAFAPAFFGANPGEVRSGRHAGLRVLSEEEAARIRRVMSGTVLFSTADNDDGGDRNLFVVRDTNEHAQSEVLHTNTIPKEIIKALDRLEGREREVIARRFGLEGEKPQTLEQIGTRMNLSRERIRQIEKEALGHMKQIPGLQEVYEDLGKASFNCYTSNN